MSEQFREGEPVVLEKCGCAVEYGYRPFQNALVFCNLHARAAEMRELLRRGLIDFPSYYPEHFKWHNEARALLEETR